MRLSTRRGATAARWSVPRVVQFVEDVAQDRLGIDGAEDRRGFAHGEGSGAEGFDDEAERLQFAPPSPAAVPASSQASRSPGSAAPAAPRRSRPAAVSALVDQPLMRRVLIDDDDSGLGLGDDVILVQLRRAAPRGERVAGCRPRPPRPGTRARSTRAGPRRFFGQSRRLPAGGRAQRGRRRAVHLVDARPVSGVNAPSVAPATVLEARCPASASAWRRPETIRPRAMPGSRNRTSDFAGCTFTSTRSGRSPRRAPPPDACRG
jgi:hypothetical protein